jgi:hypothetical protein
VSATGQADATGLTGPVDLPKRADLADRPASPGLAAPAGQLDPADLSDSTGLPDPADLPALAGLSDPADLPDLAGLPELANLPDPTGRPAPADLSEPATEAELPRAVLQIIREASAEPRLIALEEILERLWERGLAERLETAPPDEPGTALAAIVADRPEIAALTSRSGRPLYHDPALLSRSYARLLDNQDAPEALVAEAVRSNSRDYPRPVPVELFEEPPFGLAPQDLAAILAAMAAKPEFGDIATIQTSTGTAYLFSSLYLPRAYAVFLAEQEASLAMNP